MNPWPCIEARIRQSTGTDFTISQRHALGGGCINNAQRLHGANQDYFVKLNQATHSAMFSAEAQALKLMAHTRTVRVPLPVCHGTCAGHAYLVLEYLPLQGRADLSRLARQLAAMHQCSAAQYGWDIDNTIGLTPQTNTPSIDWVSFWSDRRLGPQLALAAANGHGGELQDLGERLLSDFPVLFETYTPTASMLHGDLWAGNCGALTDGEPVLFDPALYYGDRETDLAMTCLFGGFGDAFHSTYQSIWPLQAGYTTRRTFYNIYHVLNHLNLFGGGYGDQAIAMIKRVLSHL